MILNENQVEEIRKNPNNQNWISLSYRICSYNIDKLPEDIKKEYMSFIREFQDKLDWHLISSIKLSKEFIAEFINKINLPALQRNNHISDEVKEFCKIFI